MEASLEIEGTWQPLRAELEGVLAPEMAISKMEFRLQSGRYRVQFGGQTSDEGDYSVTVEPAQIMLTLRGIRGTNAGREIPAIVQLRGDRLRVCYGLNGVRPAEFVSGPGSGRYLVTYRRKQASR